jgi:hypothetical protein
MMVRRLGTAPGTSLIRLAIKMIVRVLDGRMDIDEEFRR